MANETHFWEARKEFLEQFDDAPDGNDLDPLAGHLEIDGVEHAEAPAHLHVGEDGPARDTGTAGVTKPTYRRSPIRRVNPLQTCMRCKHFRYEYGQQIAANPRFIAFLSRERGFLDPRLASVEDGREVHTPWFDASLMGLCAEDAGCATSALSSCDGFKAGPTKMFVGNVLRTAGKLIGGKIIGS